MALSDSSGWVSSSQTPDLNAQQYLTPRYLEAVLKAIESNTPRRGYGYEVHSSPRGWTIGINQQPQGRKLRFFVVTMFSDNNQFYANCSVGMVNRTIPKMNGQYLDKTGTPPSIEINGHGYVGVTVTYQSGKVFPNESVIEFRTTLSTNDTEVTSFYPLAIVDIIDGQPLVSQLSDTNLVVNRMKIGSDLYSWSWSN
jgi:hypothetical protein